MLKLTWHQSAMKISIIHSQHSLPFSSNKMSVESTWFSTYFYKTRNYKTNNIILKLHRLRAMTIDKASQWSISQYMIKKFIISYSCLLFHTHYYSYCFMSLVKKQPFVAFGAIKSSHFTGQCYYNIWCLIHPQLFSFIFSLFLDIRIFIFSK